MWQSQTHTGRSAAPSVGGFFSGSMSASASRSTDREASNRGARISDNALVDNGLARVVERVRESRNTPEFQWFVNDYLLRLAHKRVSGMHVGSPCKGILHPADSWVNWSTTQGLNRTDYPETHWLRTLVAWGFTPTPDGRNVYLPSRSDAWRLLELLREAVKVEVAFSEISDIMERDTATDITEDQLVQEQLEIVDTRLEKAFAAALELQEEIKRLASENEMLRADGEECRRRLEQAQQEHEAARDQLFNSMDAEPAGAAKDALAEATTKFPELPPPPPPPPAASTVHTETVLAAADNNMLELDRAEISLADMLRESKANLRSEPVELAQQQEDARNALQTSFLALALKSRRRGIEGDDTEEEEEEENFDAFAEVETNRLQVSSAMRKLLVRIENAPQHICNGCNCAAGTSRCARCNKAYYCSTACQKHDWTQRHQHICRTASIAPRL